MATILQQWIRRLLDYVPYPLALQSLITLVLLATLPGALVEQGLALSLRFVLMCALIGLSLLTCWLVPIRQMRYWKQLAYLLLQVGMIWLAQLLMPAQLLGYVYLVIVLQAVFLFKPLLWAPFAAGVYMLWSGSLMIASANLADWIRANLALAFPGLCILIAAALYAHQHRRHEQVAQVLQEMQRRYDQLLAHLRDAQQNATLEERNRFAQTIAGDISGALGQIEQSITHAISQAQTNLSRLDATVAQTRSAASVAIDRMRAVVSTLRLGTREEHEPEPEPPQLSLPPDELMTLRSQRTITWGLPLAFVGIALPLALLGGSVSLTPTILFALLCTLLIGGYIFTQRIRNPLLVQLGLAGQVIAVLSMAFVTQTLPLMLGLLLVIWQIAMRLSTGQMLAFVIGVQSFIGLAFTHVLPVTISDSTQLLVFCVACLAVVGLVGPARRQLVRRRQIEARLARLARLTSELEQQLAQMRALAAAVERTRLAREIHDDLGHRLMLLHIQLQLVEELIEESPNEALEQLCSTRDQLRDAWASVLGTADAVLALDGATLGPALEQLVRHCQELAAMRITLRTIGELSYLGAPVACTIYRAVQEGLTNACKYAQAESAEVLVYCDDVEIQVRVRDDGCGTAGPAPASGDGHFGLIGLRERASLLGGSVEAGPLPERGFLLAMTIPLA